MAFLIFVLVIIFLIFIIKEAAKKDARPGVSSFKLTSDSKVGIGYTPKVEEYNPYSKKKYFLTLSELKFFGILKQIIEDNYLIFPQVVLSSILEIRTRGFHPHKDRNPVNRKTLDFVIFDKQYITPLLVIELDDSSHNLYSRQERDGLVNDVLTKAKINFLRIKTQYTYNIPELKTKIYSKLHSNI